MHVGRSLQCQTQCQIVTVGGFVNTATSAGQKAFGSLGTLTIILDNKN